MTTTTSEAMARAVALEVTRELLEKNPGAVLETDPRKWREFATSLSIRVWIAYDEMRRTAERSHSQ